MNQSDKKILEFIKNSGVNYFLQESPRNWFENTNKINLQDTNNVDNYKLSKIQSVIKNIEKHQTNLQESANKLVVYDGSLDAKVMFIGEAPGRDEDEQGIPFVGKAGQLLNKMLAAIKLKTRSIYYKCC